MSKIRLLLDTHAAVFWWKASPFLGQQAFQAMAADQADISVSAISGLELAIKHRIGKFDDIGDPTLRFPALMAQHRFTSVAITERHALAAGMLPGDHRDPFDRLIAAQALEEDFTVVTRDPEFERFGCKVLW